MRIFVKILYESIAQALQQLTGNKLRSLLSLLGITIGVFCIISVQTAVDSLAVSIKDGFSELGSDVIYVDKIPWNENPEANYWKYTKRPDPSFKDYEQIKRKSTQTEAAAYTVYTAGKTIKYKSSNVDGAFIMGTTYEYTDIQNMTFRQGRYFTPIEYQTGANKVVLGYKVADELFGTLDPLGRYVKLFGHKFQVIGVLQEEGENVFNFINYDEVIWVGFNTIRRFINIRDKWRVGRTLNAKAKSGVDIETLKDELTGVLRAGRRLKPKEDDNFALNELSLLNQVLDNVFSVMNIAGWWIGIFALIVGVFSIANIMFVSVRERTNIIGVKKAIGAKKYMILLEFLIEAIILCLIGGMVGLLFVYGILKGISGFLPFSFFLTPGNLLLGVSVSVISGLIAGIIPAYLGARLDPVVAIRQ